MTARLDYRKFAKEPLKALLDMEAYVAQCGLDHKLLHMIKLRASQTNGCAYCIDMHWKDARAAGETDQRLYGLDAWRQRPPRYCQIADDSRRRPSRRDERWEISSVACHRTQPPGSRRFVSSPGGILLINPPPFPALTPSRRSGNTFIR
jgi:AhpD family alkylhydroperoxidase